jgi:hypothetical protein
VSLFARLGETLVRIRARALHLEAGAEVGVILDRARHDVLPGCQEAADVVERRFGVGQGGTERGVADTVRVDRQDLVEVIGRDDPDRCAAEELTRVQTDLLGVVDPYACKLVVGPFDDRPECVLADAARAPLDDPEAHR